tara:strand:- start:207 stop:416 length:210 start_codon:yes stop_codon:yes gene_type:complete
MDFLIPSKKVSKCPLCKGSGFVPLLDDNMSTMDEYGDYTIEIGCKRCKGKGKIIKKVDLSLESLKDLLK